MAGGKETGMSGVDNSAIDRYILSSVPATFMELHVRAEQYFGQEMYRPIDRRLQSLRKRGLIASTRVKERGVVWDKSPNRR